VASFGSDQRNPVYNANTGFVNDGISHP